MDKESLQQKWLELKAAEDQAKKSRLEIEQLLLDAYADEIKDAKSNTCNIGSLKITTGENRKWNQSKLAEIKASNPSAFPFKVEYKEDRKFTSVLEDQNPEYFKEMFSDALTITPRKPSFKEA